MKHLVVLFIACLSMGIHAQETVEKTVGEFKELKVYDLISVNLIKSDINKIEISGNNADKVETVNKNGTLKVRMSIDNSFNGEKTKVNIYYTSIGTIDVNEGSMVTSKDTLKQFEIHLKAQEGAKIDIPLNVSFVVVKSITGGNITTQGTAKNEQISILTGGIYNGQLLESETSKVTVQAAGEAHVKTSKELDITIRAGGDVYVYGNPETITENKVLGGRILRVD
ncbi:head GIN domain-containing protein [Formosa sp. PL04]|uniref:head GIN domain-containing protein n=1 Tax=Formosa sp. PL04 TaxID=3081755 RepID=UPI002980CE63|nr:head GIN domain-containing protein [Formosa sp. PL04]MDW5288957.1 head GIN domain-containing protein [Formosa sp. PL04]